MAQRLLCKRNFGEISDFLEVFFFHKYVREKIIFRVRQFCKNTFVANAHSISDFLEKLNLGIEDLVISFNHSDCKLNQFNLFFIREGRICNFAQIVFQEYTALLVYFIDIGVKNLLNI